jgi:hypothetical protein
MFLTDRLVCVSTHDALGVGLLLLVVTLALVGLSRMVAMFRGE